MRFGKNFDRSKPALLLPTRVYMPLVVGKFLDSYNRAVWKFGKNKNRDRGFPRGEWLMKSRFCPFTGWDAATPHHSAPDGRKTCRRSDVRRRTTGLMMHLACGTAVCIALRTRPRRWLFFNCCSIRVWWAREQSACRAKHMGDITAGSDALQVYLVKILCIFCNFLRNSRDLHFSNAGRNR